MLLTSSSHKGEDQEWIHGGRSRAGLVVESLYTSRGEGGWPLLLPVQTHLQLSLSQDLGSTLLFLATLWVRDLQVIRTFTF